MKAVEIAAKILGGNRGDVGLLNSNLYDELEQVNSLLAGIGEELTSCQVISMIINQWSKEHPEECPYGD